jgi:molybdenum cofactor synthesis domain-containing protein
MKEQTCAVVVVGNEVLSGKIHDTNSYFAARELRKAGVALKRIAVVADEVDAIAQEVRYCAERFDIVLTSGGIGPTHDDLTMEGVAAAFGRKLVADPALSALIDEHSGGRRLAARFKMANVPEGALLSHSPDLWFPTVRLDNVFILPGIPQLFEPKVVKLCAEFAASPYFMRVIYSQAGESVIAEYLNACLERFPELLLGSYPEIDNSEYRVKITLESKDRVYLEQAFDHLLQLLPREAVVKTE